jgi:hypothetical protein
MIRFLAALLVLALSPAMAAERMTIGYVDRADDPRHEDRTGFGGILLEQRGRAIDGAKLALEDLAAVGRSLNIEINLAEARAENADAIAGAAEKLRRDRGVRFILIDAPTEALIASARGARDAMLFNVATDTDALRGTDCQAQIMHTIPSLAMRTDALVQLIVARKARHPGARGPRGTRRGRGARARALGQALRRPDRGEAAVRSGQRSARARPEQSCAADRRAGL